MMMESALDPFESLFANEPMQSTFDPFLLDGQIKVDEFDINSTPFSPTTSGLVDDPEMNFDIDMFQEYLEQLISSDSSSSSPSSSATDSEPATREMGTDPMVEMAPPAQPVISQTTKPLRLVSTTQLNQFLNQPIIIFHQSGSKPTMNNTPASISLVAMEEYPPTETETTVSTEIFGTMTPSPSNDSSDEGISSSPDAAHEPNNGSMVTDLTALPKAGALTLTNEELKLIKQDGHSAPTKLPLSKSDERMLKRVQRKIKNKISAQESRRKKKEYVDALEKQIADYVSENNSLKKRMATIEKSHKTLAQERDLLQSMIGKTTTPAPSTALMVFALFFAVLFGIWSPITMKSAIDEKSLSQSLALNPSNSYLSALSSQKSLLEQQEAAHTNSVSDTYRSRVLLSIDDHDHHHHGPYLQSSYKPKTASPSLTAAPGYTYSKTVERYMNKKIKSGRLGETQPHFKRSLSDDSSSMILDEEFGYKRRRTNNNNYHASEKVVVIEETEDHVTHGVNQSKPVKIIRVERTVPAVGNDTWKMAQRTVNE